MDKLAATRDDGGHIWAQHKFSKLTLVCCNKCGIVKRADGKNKPCKGKVKVALR